MLAFTTDEARWHAVAERDRDADGAFICAVRTTGIYCRPICPSRPKPENVEFFENWQAAERAGYRACKRCKPKREPGLVERLDRVDWQGVAAALDELGYATTGALLTPQECHAMAQKYDDAGAFRSRIVMRRHAFGEGEYQYFADPLPEIVETLRQAAYPRLVPIANRWREALDLGPPLPAELDGFLDQCHAAGQKRPTPLLLKYGPGDYNRLHQDLYGELHFPLQMAVLLSRPGHDFEGGEFVLTEQRPRMQSRAEVVPLRQGEAVIFAVNLRPARGARGFYRVTMRHGVSRIRSGRRHCLGIIFHDAK